MPEGTSNSLVNLGDVTKPADTLIKKISKAVGGLFAPYQIERVAKAEANAALIKAQSEIQITALHRRAMQRFIEEEAQKQKNIEEITAKALPHLGQNAKPDSMEDDWVTNFFDKSRIVSDSQMQDLWSRVLAGEANTPGTYSKRTVNFLSDLDKNDAELLSKLCGFGWIIGDVVPLVFDYQADIYQRNGITFSALNHLESIGLVQLSGFGNYNLIVPQKTLVFYYFRQLQLEMTKESKNKLDIGHVTLTKVGRELAPICGGKPVEGFWEYVTDKWKLHLPSAASKQGQVSDNPFV